MTILKLWIVSVEIGKAQESLHLLYCLWLWPVQDELDFPLSIWTPEGLNHSGHQEWWRPSFTHLPSGYKWGYKHSAGLAWRRTCKFLPEPQAPWISRYGIWLFGNWESGSQCKAENPNPSYPQRRSKKQLVKKMVPVVTPLTHTPLLFQDGQKVDFSFLEAWPQTAGRWHSPMANEVEVKWLSAFLRHSWVPCIQGWITSYLWLSGILMNVKATAICIITDQGKLVTQLSLQ